MTMRNFLFLLESLTSYPAEGFFGVDDTILDELEVVEVRDPQGFELFLMNTRWTLDLMLLRLFFDSKSRRDRKEHCSLTLGAP